MEQRIQVSCYLMVTIYLPDSEKRLPVGSLRRKYLKYDGPKDYGREKSLSARFWNFSSRPSGKTVLGVAADIAV
ncbi:hypothetical protein TNIN_296371 [Trichonephila inaurata madagascariensis]|uniref:Uncharacterized protein n=1 Tax=Trichonephila inaurata madagascariensis TaxID=2747483 RepID=A0A8X6XVR8_9ARAC|nr:hypothetical protein TNIN_296371 [Trichonephila inaurata madagascariensis]